MNLAFHLARNSRQPGASAAPRKWGKGGIKSPAALTLLELVVVVGIIGVLAVIVAGLFEPLRNRIEKAVCMGHMRQLHALLGSHIVDHGSWPQVPGELTAEQKTAWWTDHFEDRGISPSVLECPTIRRLAESEGVPPEEQPPMHYMITEFDEHAFSPYRWSTQPWLIEITNAHGGGNLIIFPDGHIVGFFDYLETLPKTQ